MTYIEKLREMKREKDFEERKKKIIRDNNMGKVQHALSLLRL
jgi:hypothetical protein